MNTTNTNTYLSQLKIFHYAFSLEIIFLGLIVMYLVQSGITNIQLGSSVEQILIALLLILFLLVIPLGNNLLKKKLTQIREKSSLEEKKISYRNLYILMLAVLDGCAVLDIVVFLISRNYNILLLVLFVLILLFLKRPTKDRIIDDLALDKEQAAFLD